MSFSQVRLVSQSAALAGRVDGPSHVAAMQYNAADNAAILEIHHSFFIEFPSVVGMQFHSANTLSATGLLGTSNGDRKPGWNSLPEPKSGAYTLLLANT